MSEELFGDFWWLIFPIFGMVMAVIGALKSNNDVDDVHARARRDLGGK